MEKINLLKPDEILPVKKKLDKVYNKLNECLFGREDMHKILLIAILSRGHVLLEGLPGLGKTALVLSLSQLLNLDVKRIQFTPDLMPSDILGSHILQENKDGIREMKFKPGPIFCNFLLGDEINRASPKTQSALLEAMQEKNVTLIGDSKKLPDPFFVLATQNPIELEGTYPLPEAQLDRFLFKLIITSPSVEVMEMIITERHHGIVPEQKPILGKKELLEMFRFVDRIVIPDAVANYIARIVGNTNPDSRISGISDYIKYGASPRAAIAIAEASRVSALIDGRPSIGFDDVNFVAPWALHHRIILEYKARGDDLTELDIVNKVIECTNISKQELPKSVKMLGK